MLSLNYTVPYLGSRSINLYGETEKIYRFLDDRQQIFRLKNLNQLGIISEVIQTAHHPKYQYVYLLMVLIDEIKILKGSYPISRNIIRNVTGIELMKSWAMLLSIGHMPGTFPSEKAVLRLLCEDKNVYGQFIRSFKDEQMKEYCKRIVDEQNVYSFYHVLSFHRIVRYTHSSTQRAISNLMAEHLAAYTYSGDAQCLRDLRNLFGRLRMIAYMLLDSYYTGSLTIFNLTNMQDIKAHIDDPYFDSLIREFNEYLRNKVYKSEKNIVAETLLYKAFYEQFQKQKEPLAYIDSHMYSSSDVDLRKLYNRYLRKEKITIESYQLLLAVYTSRTDVIRQENELYESIEGGRITTSRRPKILYSIDCSPGKRGSRIKIFTSVPSKKISLKVLIAILRAVTALAIRNELARVGEFRNVRDDLNLKMLFKRDSVLNYKNICMAVFELVFGECICQMKAIVRKNDIELPEVFYEDTPGMLEEYIVSKSIRDPEILQLSRLMNKIHTRANIRSTFLVFTSNLELFSKKADDVISCGEIDGAILEIQKARLIVYFLEAKKVKRGRMRAYRQLNNIRRCIYSRYLGNYMTRICRVDVADRGAYLKLTVDPKTS